MNKTMDKETTNRKSYQKPSMEVVRLQNTPTLLQGSGDSVPGWGGEGG